MAMPRVNRNPLPTEANANNKRSAGRILTTRLKCKIGSSRKHQVIEISGTGVQLEVRGSAKYRPERQVVITLIWRDIEVVVQGVIIWQRKSGFRRSQVGLRFDDLNPSEKSAVARIAIATRDAVTETNG